MHIVILGAGTVGYSVARLLSRNRHDVTLVDRNADVLDARGATLDAMTLAGNVSQASVLFQAGVMNADICMAVTDSDETNLVAASIAKKMGATRVIARVYAPVANNLDVFDYYSHFGIDRIISLEQLTAVRLAQEIDNFTESLNMESNLYGNLELMEFEMLEGARGVGKRIRDLGFPSNVRIGAISRARTPFIPAADDVLKVNDKIAVFGIYEDLLKVCKSLGGKLPQKKTIVIAGGGETGLHLAQILQKRHKIRILESDRERCEDLAEILGRSAEVINIDLHDRIDMEEEHIGRADVFVACTGDDENNLIGCVEAKEMGVRKTCCVISRVNYGEVIKNKLGIDFWTSPNETTARRVMNFLQRGAVISRDTIFRSQIQLLEIEVQPNSPISKVPLRKAELPPQCIILGATRKRGRTNEVPGADFRFEPGDIALIVTTLTGADEVTERFEKSI